MLIIAVYTCNYLVGSAMISAAIYSLTLWAFLAEPALKFSDMNFR